jgi:hypothetical protein
MGSLITGLWLEFTPYPIRGRSDGLKVFCRHSGGRRNPVSWKTKVKNPHNDGLFSIIWTLFEL